MFLVMGLVDRIVLFKLRDTLSFDDEFLSLIFFGGVDSWVAEVTTSRTPMMV